MWTQALSPLGLVTSLSHGKQAVDNVGTQTRIRTCGYCERQEQNQERVNDSERKISDAGSTVQKLTEQKHNVPVIN